MKILALDSSGLVASVALLENDNLVAEFTVNNKKTHSQTLLPMLDEVVNAAGIELDAVDQRRTFTAGTCKEIYCKK